MGGSSGGGPFRYQSPETLRNRVREAEEQAKDAAFEAALSGTLGDLLRDYNARDTALVRERLDDLKGALEGTIEGSVDQIFGGSVAKRTYVDGLSDVDSLVIINETDLEDITPQAALDHMEKSIEEGLGKAVSVHHGRMAVTVQYDDGMTIQLLPAIKDAGGRLQVPSSRQDGWSRINPAAFAEALTRHNQQCGNKLVPTIKLAKAINGTLPEAQRLSGYHMESLGIAAFRNYDGEKTTTAMLPVFFERARELVLSPIRDTTGQSVHVDDYLGPVNSPERLAISHVMGRIARRMRNATAAGSTAQWRSMFGFDE
jgi:Second Messenger Oligonucleotide or Dinucleotide Synthetase domain